MKKIGILVFLAFLECLGSTAHAQALPLSDSATASVITCGPGNDFYTTFGHSAIRISDPHRGIDYVYNYGTFDFDTPHFYLKFARGRLDYCLSRTSFNIFMSVYDYEQRYVVEQQLNFTSQEVRNLYLMLEWNYLPENRYYHYDLFRDNCATRVRDMVEAASGKNKILIPECELVSCRGFVHRSTGPTLEWWTLGIDLLLGLPTDKRCSISDAMFHPEMMFTFYNAATRKNEPLVNNVFQWLTDVRPPLRRSYPPMVVFSLIFVAVAVLSWRKLWPRWADRVLFILAGLMGLVLCFMWFGTDHWCTKWNLNILWASPLLIMIAIRLQRSPRWALWLQLACFAVAAVYVLVCGLSVALLPIILTLALRVACLIPRKPRLLQQQR